MDIDALLEAFQGNLYSYPNKWFISNEGILKKMCFVALTKISGEANYVTVT